MFVVLVVNMYFVWGVFPQFYKFIVSYAYATCLYFVCQNTANAVETFVISSKSAIGKRGRGEGGGGGCSVSIFVLHTVYQGRWLTNIGVSVT